MAQECSKILRWIEAIMLESAIYRIPKSISKKLNQIDLNEENPEGLGTDNMTVDGFDVNQEEVTENALKNIFKDFNLK